MQQDPARRVATVSRWIGRVVTIIVLLFWGFFIFGHIFGDDGSGDKPLTTHDYLGFVLMGGWLLGLALAWKWELVGALVALVSYVVFLFAWNAEIVSPFLLIPVGAVAYLLAWYTSRQQEQPAS